ncbi:hypothetical protein I6I99_19045 [Sphingobacterium multivorum]|nr:hypothetical protein [Sphingobacterium multivorum]QQT29428.1 hypothetical protein I6I99_19045 [Sphingobacterium multivorum]
MSYESTVYRILIASPSDVDEEREVASRIIQDWNDLNSFNKKIVLLPVKWETHSSPTFGIRPQEAINRQIVDDCDMLIGFFWTKIGTPTGEDISGTIEEIKRVSDARKPVMLYFSKRGKDPSLIDIKQLEALTKFKEETYKIALVENYNSIVDFRDKVSRQIEMKIRELQENKESGSELITYSFIDTKTGKLTDNCLTSKLERVNFDNLKLEEIIKKNSKIKKNTWQFRRDITNYVRGINNIPIILGVCNNSNRTLTNVIVELRINTAKEDNVEIYSTGSNDENELYHNLSNLNMTTEEKDNILKLFNKKLTKTSPNTWELNSKPFSLLPGKTKAIDSIIILSPFADASINFNITLYSENILQSIESSCSLNIKVSQRELTTKEIKEVIEQLDDDDLPF